jgi:rod shape determining protein RodA
MNIHAPNNRSGTFLLSRVDFIGVAVVFLLMVIGWFNIYSAEYSEEQKKIFDFTLNHGKQIINIAIAMVLATIILLLNARMFDTISYLVYAAAIGLLLVTLVTGKVVHAAKGWIQIGGFQLQTGELAKLATAMALAKFISTHGVDIRNTKDRLIAFVIIMLPCLIILLQNDTGSAIVFFAFVFVLYRQGISPLYLIIPIVVAIVSLSVLMVGKYPVLIAEGIIGAISYLVVRRSRRVVFLLIALIFGTSILVFGVDFGFNHIFKDYQRERINILLGKEVDVKGAGYNVHQSLIAIGSGGVMGKGFLKGTQTKFKFVPEQSTDFIFCTVGEEYGFMGSAALVLLYIVLMYRIVVIAERQKFLYNRLYGYGVVSVIFFHFTINMGMTLGLFPVVGIPLPFVSYGGSSMLSFTIMMFILFKLDAANSEY